MFYLATLHCLLSVCLCESMSTVGVCALMGVSGEVVMAVTCADMCRQVLVVTQGVHVGSATSVADTNPPRRPPSLTGAVLQPTLRPFAALLPSGHCL